MNNQLLVKSKDVVVKRVIAASSVSLELRRTCPVHSPKFLPQTHPLTQPQASPRQYRPLDCVQCFTQQTDMCNESNIKKEVESMLFGDKDNRQNRKNNTLALSTMYANILREMPKLLDDHDFTIYSDDLEFVSTFQLIPSIQGRSSYQITLKTWFKSLTLLYTGLYMDIQNIAKDTENNVVEMRWSISGQYRINQFNVRVFEGVSTFAPNDDGLIMRHVLDKINIDKLQTKIFTVNPMS